MINLTHTEAALWLESFACDETTAFTAQIAVQYETQRTAQLQFSIEYLLLARTTKHLFC